MKKLTIVFLSLIISVMLTSCSEKNSQEIAEPQFLDVKLTVNPEKAQPNEPITFEAAVTYGKEKVTDADEVVFEIWRANDENHEKIEMKSDKDGVYRLKKSFAKDGTYYIYSHVTAKSMHNMPKKEFVVGVPSPPEKD